MWLLLWLLLLLLLVAVFVAVVVVVVVAYWLLVVDYWLLVVDCSLLFVGCWLLVVVLVSPGWAFLTPLLGRPSARGRTDGRTTSIGIGTTTLRIYLIIWVVPLCNHHHNDIILHVLYRIFVGSRTQTSTSTIMFKDFHQPKQGWIALSFLFSWLVGGLLS